MTPLYPNKYATYESKYSLSDAVAHLSAKVRKDNLPNRLRGGILGTARPEKVILRHFYPWQMFSGGVRFEGSFVEKDRSTVLAGTFKMPTSGRVFIILWLAVTVLLFCYSIITVELLPIPISMLFLWIITILITWRWGKLDIDYISHAVKDALL